VSCYRLLNWKLFLAFFLPGFLRSTARGSRFNKPAAFKTLQAADKFDAVINARGGGVKGQAEAVKLGIARALLQVNPEYRPALKAAGLLKRDPRAVERKKPGKKKARKSFQFSKR
jgi:small subunit ribosomal protein S9